MLETPNTVDSIYTGLKALGIAEGDVLLVHSSLSSFGMVYGAQEAVVRALLSSVGSNGTIVMPAFTWENDDPVNFENPPIPEEWHQLFREKALPFNKDTTPVFVRGLGIIAEYFRTYPGTFRSDHPYVSFTANGKLAKQIVTNHVLTPSQGMDSPLGKLYDFGAKILLLGVDYGSCTAFHLSEVLAQKCSKVSARHLLVENGKRVWKTIEDYEYEGNYEFIDIGSAFEQNANVTIKRIGQATCKLFDLKTAVDFATQWIMENA